MSETTTGARALRAVPTPDPLTGLTGAPAAIYSELVGAPGVTVTELALAAGVGRSTAGEGPGHSRRARPGHPRPGRAHRGPSHPRPLAVLPERAQQEQRNAGTR